MRTILLLTLSALLAASLYYAYGLWVAVDADMPAGLWIAMILGVLFSVMIGAGLMALVFYSSRRGYDDRASGR
jgi:uncharacterized membrane protein YoaK (UPF0700 family)